MPLPVHPGLQFHFDPLAGGQSAPETFPFGLADPEAGRVERDLEEFLLRLGRCGRIRRDKDDRPCAQHGGVHPAVPGVEVQQHDAPARLFAVEIGEFAGAAVNQRGRAVRRAGSVDVRTRLGQTA